MTELQIQGFHVAYIKSIGKY